MDLNKVYDHFIHVLIYKLWLSSREPLIFWCLDHYEYISFCSWGIFGSRLSTNYISVFLVFLYRFDDSYDSDFLMNGSYLLPSCVCGEINLLIYSLIFNIQYTHSHLHPQSHFNSPHIHTFFLTFEISSVVKIFIARSYHKHFFFHMLLFWSISFPLRVHKNGCNDSSVFIRI